MNGNTLTIDALENSIIERSQAATATSALDVGTGLAVYATNQEPEYSSDCCSSNNY